LPGPQIRVVASYSWTGTKHPALYRELVHILKDLWDCRRIVVDATGVGAGVASFLKEALGSRVVPFNFTSKSKSELGYALLTAVNSGRLKLHAPDASPEYGEMLHQLEICRIHCSANHTLNFFVDPAAGHDDFVSALALAVEASASIPKPRTATMSTYL
jgi:hypothetical protein